jgi:hypothetical protein
VNDRIRSCVGYHGFKFDESIRYAKSRMDVKDGLKIDESIGNDKSRMDVKDGLKAEEIIWMWQDQDCGEIKNYVICEI